MFPEVTTATRVADGYYAYGSYNEKSKHKYLWPKWSSHTILDRHIHPNL